MSRHSTVAALNVASCSRFPVRPQKSFIAHLTLLYPPVEQVDRLSEELAELVDFEEWTDDDVAQISAEAMVGIMTSSVEIRRKASLIELLFQWVPIANISDEVTACVIQSIHIWNLHFNEVYAIRTAVWNYLKDATLRNDSILKLQPDGRLNLTPRNPKRFDGDETKEYIFVVQELKKLTRGPHPTNFRAIAAYDYTMRCDDPKSADCHLGEPISTNRPPQLGFNPTKQAHPACFQSFFSNQQVVIEEVIDMNMKQTCKSPNATTFDYMSHDGSPSARRRKSSSEESTSSDSEEERERQWELSDAQYSLTHQLTAIQVRE